MARDAEPCGGRGEGVGVVHRPGRALAGKEPGGVSGRAEAFPPVRALTEGDGKPHGRELKEVIDSFRKKK